MAHIEVSGVHIGVLVVRTRAWVARTVASVARTGAWVVRTVVLVDHSEVLVARTLKTVSEGLTRVAAALEEVGRKSGAAGSPRLSTGAHTPGLVPCTCPD